MSANLRRMLMMAAAMGPGGEAVVPAGPLLAAGGEFTITAAGGTGAKSFAHGLATTPQVIIFTTNRQAAGAAASASHVQMLGVAKSSTEEWCYTGTDVDNSATVVCRSIMRNDCCIVVGATNGSAADDLRADFTSFDATNFNINVSDAPAADTVIQFLALAGDGLEVDVGTVTSLAVGAGDENFDVVGFEPKFLMFGIGAGAAVNTYVVDAVTSIGIADENLNQRALGHGSDHNTAAADCKTILDDGAVVFQMIPGSGVDNHRMVLASMRPTGFSLTYANNPPEDRQIGYLALGGEGLKAFVGSGAARTTTGTQGYTTTGVTPQLVLLFGCEATAVDTATDHIRQSVGWAIGTTANRCVAAASADAADPTNMGVATLSTKCIRYASVTAGTAIAEADMDAVAAGSFTLDWTTVDATARLFSFAALELS